MKNRWLTRSLLAPLLFCLIGCDQDPSSPKRSTAKPRIMALGSLEPLVEKAWSLMASGKHDECSAFVDAEFAKIESKAYEQEKSLLFFPEMGPGYKWHELDGAGNLLRVKQESLKRQGKHAEAVPVWEMMFNDFPHFQSWRVPNRTWRPAEEARQSWQEYHLHKAIKERKLDTYDYALETIFDKRMRDYVVMGAGEQLLKHGDIEGLEYACDFFSKTPKWQQHSNSEFLALLINGCSSYQNKVPDAQWDKLKQSLERWIKEKPDSAVAPIALASYWISYAWVARGSGYADTVTAAGWQKFGERIAAARETLDKAKRDSPLWYSKRLKVCMAESAEAQEVKTIFTEGIKKYPGFQPISTQMVYMLLPRWLGQPGDWENYAAMIGKEQDAGAYLELCLYAAELEGREEVGTNKNVSWPLLKEGFEQQIKRNPRDLWLKNNYAAYAYLRDDQAAGKRAFMLMHNIAHPDVWEGKEDFINVKNWAEQ